MKRALTANDEFQFRDPSTDEIRVFPSDVHFQASLCNEIQLYVDTLSTNIKKAQRAYLGLFTRNLSHAEYVAINIRTIDEIKKQHAVELRLS